MPTNWEDYLSAPAARQAYRGCRTLCGVAFEPVRRMLEDIVDALAPKSVACLGAGVLNDIPFRQLLLSGAVIHLVDWIPGVVETGIDQSIIRRGADGGPECAFCLLGEIGARPFCRRYGGASAGRPGVCDNFDQVGEDPIVCGSYERGERPTIHCQDVTGGYASAFARGAYETALTAGSWRQALKQAGAVAKRVRRNRTSIDIADGSIDLVTSSMVMSQFVFEPYDYFSRQVADRLGAPSAQEERRLRGSLEALHAELLVNQLEAHCDEIERLLAPGGRCFAAFEMYQFDSGRGAWFLARDMQRTLDILDRRFDFDFDMMPPSKAMAELRFEDSSAVIHTVLLRRKES